LSAPQKAVSVMKGMIRMTETTKPKTYQQTENKQEHEGDQRMTTETQNKTAKRTDNQAEKKQELLRLKTGYDQHASLSL
jgi:Sec-independent protein translocase protein TatA